VTGWAEVFTERTGVVRAFDDLVGLGTIADASSPSLWLFHATRIADGSRTIDEGASVAFRVEPGPTGFEAVAVAPV
jgi:cold shock CspA family protein